MNGLKPFPFMPKGILSTDEEANSAAASGMYHVFGRNGISVVSNYSIMTVFNDGQGYVIQMTFRPGEDVVGFRRNYNGERGDFRSFVLASWKHGLPLYRTWRCAYQDRVAPACTGPPVF